MQQTIDSGIKIGDIEMIFVIASYHIILDRVILATKETD